MKVSQFNEKLNKVDGVVHVIEEEVTLTDGMYEAELKHDNINTATFAVYTGSKLTGERINSYVLSTPSLTPWKKIVRVSAETDKVFLTYETDGDTVEADDYNQLQAAVTETQEALNEEIERAGQAELDMSSSLDEEVGRAMAKEAQLEKSLDANIKTVNEGLENRYVKEQVYTKEEVMERLQQLIGDAPKGLSTIAEIAAALDNDSKFASTVMYLLDGKVDKVKGKELSTNDYSDKEKDLLAAVSLAMHEHHNQASLNKITEKTFDTLDYLANHTYDTKNPHHVTANDVEALSTKGGTMYGDLRFDSEKTNIYMNHASIYEIDHLSGGKSKSIVVSDDRRGIEFCDGDINKPYPIIVTGIADPEYGYDAVNKQYVDSRIGGSEGASGTLVASRYTEIKFGGEFKETETIYEDNSVGINSKNPIEIESIMISVPEKEFYNDITIIPAQYSIGFDESKGYRCVNVKTQITRYGDISYVGYELIVRYREVYK